MTVKAHIGGKSVAGKAFLSRTHRAQRLVVRAEAEEAAAAEASVADEGVAGSRRSRARGAYPPVDVPSVASRVSGASRAVSMRDATLFPPSAGNATRMPPRSAPGVPTRATIPARVRPVDARPSHPNVRALARPTRARPTRDPSPARASRRLGFRVRSYPVAGHIIIVASRPPSLPPRPASIAPF